MAVETHAPTLERDAPLSRAVEQTLVRQARTALDQAVAAATAAGTLNLLLWLVTLAGAGAAFVWVLVGGPAAVGARADGLARLWPLVLIWVAGLVLHGWGAAVQTREVVRADALVSMAERGAAYRAVGRPPPGAAG